MAMQSNINVTWGCSNGTYENQTNQLKNDWCEMCEATNKKNVLSPTMKKLQNEMFQLLNLIEIEKRKIPPNINTIQFYINLHSHKIQQFKNEMYFMINSNNRRCARECRPTTLKNAKKERKESKQMVQRECDSGLLNVKKLNVAQMINLLIPGYLKSVGLFKNSIIDINRLIQRYYASHDTNPDNLIGKMRINCNYLNDAVEMFSSQRHGVIVRARSNSEMVYFSLQSQTKHAIKCRGYPWKLYDIFFNGNLISLGTDSENDYSTIYNIASNTIYPIAHCLNSDSGIIGCCASAKEGIFAIGGYYHEEDNSHNRVCNIQWNGDVTPLASYWHATWCSTPLFIDNDNKVINIGGGERGFEHSSKIVGLYSFETNTWQRLADIPYKSQRSGAYYNKFDETVYVTGGSAHACGTKRKLCVRYSAHSNQWEQIAQTNWYYDVSPCVSVINNSFVLLTSEGDNGLKMEYLDIRTNCKRFTVLVGTDDKKENKGRWQFRWDRDSMYDLITNNV